MISIIGFPIVNRRRIEMAMKSNRNESSHARKPERRSFRETFFFISFFLFSETTVNEGGEKKPNQTKQKENKSFNTSSCIHAGMGPTCVWVCVCVCVCVWTSWKGDDVDDDGDEDGDGTPRRVTARVRTGRRGRGSAVAAAAGRRPRPQRNAAVPTDELSWTSPNWRGQVSIHRHAPDRRLFFLSLSLSLCVCLFFSSLVGGGSRETEWKTRNKFAAQRSFSFPFFFLSEFLVFFQFGVSFSLVAKNCTCCNFFIPFCLFSLFFLKNIPIPSSFIFPPLFLF